jgi:demethylmenaquinone methyltransferase / 2-methoxy-6-polyprenyl-1,4-benzoquinol methylase
LVEVSARTRHARELFAPLGPTYDRYARALSFGQDPRWRRFLVSCVPAEAQRVLDVATGTGSVAIELARAAPTRSVVGIDQSVEMLAAGRARVAQAGLEPRIELREGRAETLPFADGEFDALTFTYLLRYVDDPGGTLGELARVVRPGGVVAMLEFGVPRGLWRLAWEPYVRVGLPAAGAFVSPAWREVGRFLGPSIRCFWQRHPPDALVELWRAAGIHDVHARRLSLGGGVVVWGMRSRARRLDGARQRATVVPALPTPERE